MPRAGAAGTRAEGSRSHRRNCLDAKIWPHICEMQSDNLQMVKEIQSFPTGLLPVLAFSSTLNHRWLADEPFK